MNYEITAELNLKKIIAESREVAQALNKFADNLERIESKYVESQESDDELLESDDECKKCKYYNNPDYTRCSICVLNRYKNQKS